MIKQTFKDLKEWWNDNPWEFISNLLFVLLIFTIFWGAIWMHAIMTGKV